VPVLLPLILLPRILLLATIWHSRGRTWRRAKQCFEWIDELRRSWSGGERDPYRERCERWNGRANQSGHVRSGPCKARAIAPASQVSINHWNAANRRSATGDRIGGNGLGISNLPAPAEPIEGYRDSLRRASRPCSRRSLLAFGLAREWSRSAGRRRAYR